MIETRRLLADDLARIGEIDRSERIAREYVLRDGALELREVNFDAPRWPADASHPHGTPAHVREWSSLLKEHDGVLLGAFDGEDFVGFAIYRPELSPRVGQLAVLHVSRSHRGRGIGARLTREVIALAAADGALELYVSATPTQATVDFYRGLGFDVTDRRHPELLALEPDDIHMRREVRSQR